MKLKKSLLLFLILVLLSCSTKEPEINRVDVDRIISTLASDDMNGRAAFTPYADKAADFIAEEFERIGLKKWNGMDSYLQKFQMYTFKSDSALVMADGKSVDDVFVYTTEEGADWSSDSDIQNVMISAEDNFRSTFGQLRRESKSAIIWVNEAQKDIFNRYASFLRNGARTMNKEDGFTLVFILTDRQPNTFTIHFTSTVSEQPLMNVVGMIEGNRKDEYVLFSGHYDHIGIQKAIEGDSIANGANDDASGTTAVIELADYFMQKGKPERSILFVAFTAEEAGGYGSQYFSKQLDPDKIIAMFNIEMIGKPASDGPNSAWITGFDKSDFGQILQRAVEGTEYKFYADPYPDQNLFYRSDNATLARLGVPAHSISTTPIDVDKDYHQVSDEVETLDLNHLTNTIKAIAAGASTIISGKETPTRVDPSQVD